MSLSIASNPESIAVSRRLNDASSQLSDVYQRLSSGLRINSPGDDPGGLQVADGLRADTKIASVAIRNANDGLSLTSVADSALAEIGNMLDRMAELATQSANGVYSNSQRSALSSEFVALGSEIDRISKTTTFNNISLLSNSSNITLQVGLGGDANSQITLAGVNGTLAALGLAGSGSSALTFSIISTTSTSSQLAATNALSAVQLAIGTLASTRGSLGASESRLNSAIGYLTVARENYVAAESRIRDIDVAEESANLVRLQVLEQAATAVLAQANQQPATVLKLLA
jgi:flagellin